MNEFKGTKGEWAIQNDFRSPKIINESGRILFTHDSDCYDTKEDAHIYYSHNKMMANAKLIAAAPDLLEALMSIENDDNSIPKAIWDMRNAAIKKATE